MADAQLNLDENSKWYHQIDASGTIEFKTQNKYSDRNIVVNVPAAEISSNIKTSTLNDYAPLISTAGYISADKNIRDLTISSGKSISTIANNGDILSYTGVGTIHAYVGTGGTISCMTQENTISNLGDSSTTGTLNITNNTYGTVNLYNGGSADKGVSITGHVITADGGN